jgi:hypothetical protein
MSYIRDICQPLIDQLEKFATLNSHQLAGQLANLDFWVSEVEHRLSVIEGYYPRFQQLKAAQTDHVQRHRTARSEYPGDPIGESIPPIRRGVSDAELKELRDRLLKAVSHVVTRGINEGLLTEIDVREVKRRLGHMVMESDLQS